ncbi:somatomedin-B and thrombospondin type-1 domain-containing protein-like [Phymastichus coffea]|uniref:somatomedin-B and thrombospondin type-1 domain-containing protein-like n=1 Tax=Phymastichus coffea TaxID=108790 RepID=UPI00273B2189|nr:somatomedin-B and thrombospondin type-1 domain-containing protein-like [Phymastichus coffea]
MDKWVMLMVLTWCWVAERSSAGSCAAAKLCCQGRDSGCVIQKASPNAIIESPRDKPCYCDHACLRLGDCCPDFNQTCTVLDCSASEWTGWTECDNKCGPGQQTRSRAVLRPERNGGKPCSELSQSVGCQNYDACRRRARHFQVQETSLPSDGGTEEASFDSNFVPQVAEGYCAVFTILKVSKGCRRRLQSFREGSQVCVWCRKEGSPRQPRSCPADSEGAALSLAGVGRWELLNSPHDRHCHGKWLAEPRSLVRDNCHDGFCRGKALLSFL